MSKELYALWQQHVPRGVAVSGSVFTARATGAVVTDLEGRRYIDFAGGIGVLNVGATHPRVVAAVQAQAERFLHTCTHVTLHEPYLALCQALNTLVPGEFAKSTLLLNSGAEAVENAVKIARAATGRPGVVALTGAFHGRTLLGLSLTEKSQPYKQNFGPFAPAVWRAPMPHLYRMPSFGGDQAACTRACLGALQRLIEIEAGPRAVAAVIVEPVQGEGGFVVPPPDYLPAVAELCRRHGILLIADEIQTGFCRTGPFYSMEHWGVAADLTLSAKSLGGGLPIAAVTGRAEVMDAVQPGGLGGTYGGNPLASAAALAVIEVMQTENYPAKAAAIGQVVQQRFERLQRRYPCVGEVRGLGAMQALELVQPGPQQTPDPALAAAVLREALQRGLILLKAGTYGNVIRFLAPLVISEAELAEGLDILEVALAAAAEAPLRA